MSDFDAIDALLASAAEPAPLPPAERRRALREALGLSRAQVARALSVSPSTVGGWEAGRDPSGEVRGRYAYFLGQAEEKVQARLSAAGPDEQHAEPVEPPAESTESTAAATQSPAEGAEPSAEAAEAAEATPSPTPASPAAPAPPTQDELPEPQPCVLCGRPAREQVEGYPQHLDAAECAASAPSAEADTASAEPPHTALSGPSAADPDSAPATATRTVRSPGRGVKVVPVGRRAQTAGASSPDLIGTAVAETLAQHHGDVEAATAALLKRAIPDAMALLDHTRTGGRYDIVAHPWMPDILRRQSARGADRIWEARPKWTRPELPAGQHEVTALDINGAYLSALKTHLPIGQLEHSTGTPHDRRRAGVHLITPPAWDHDHVLPNPLGSRDEPGPLWVTEPTLRLLLRLSGPKYGLCDPPEIHESFTSGATEGLLEKFRVALKDARDRAIAEDDEVTLEYVKAMYSKFVSTLGESNYNRELYRSDWMHLIRSQAFANLWMKTYKAYDEGLMVVRAMGTDELHVIGDWRAVFEEGRGVTQVKVKDAYTLGEDAAVAAP
ncbi:helix-turn-helix domain-containing protein [Streptomyces sp. AN091965]|uniref:helix-turn-helix domain-containing protein n=1 Tax=Streptomyces sp. AN091965 TaxID=2927803 RepID=UPI001F61C79B|nr:helix-turn-helix transcriptional regulator [Streptomyces sp. AN091965]MCI3927983.1 helix-turn-helix transcriptional regulator [Streptomyces sp. AN091965]